MSLGSSVSEVRLRARGEADFFVELPARAGRVSPSGGSNGTSVGSRSVLVPFTDSAADSAGSE
ncbi:hypothetical protein DRB87_18005 [Pandoraea sp. XY-2]|nr:hypothetical protein DRB87_18005 [Pandoraea sp. XY-2]